jgi:murein DD-endopeptidase MepM/ murein hydrolase activator NlpD
MKLVKPWPDGYDVNPGSPYGWRVHPISKRRKFHHGVDVALPIGTPLVAPADGYVVHHGSGASGGFVLILKHADDLFTVYYHLRQKSHLSKGAIVRRGDRVAVSGNSGRSTGPHLHWEVRRSRKWGDTVDPMSYLVEEIVVKSDPIPPADPIETVAPPKKEKKVRPMSARLRRFFKTRRALRDG